MGQKVVGIVYAVVVVCTDLSGKQLHRQVGMGIVVTSGSLCDVMVCSLVWNARDVGSNPALRTIFPIFIIPAVVYSCAVQQSFGIVAPTSLKCGYMSCKMGGCEGELFVTCQSRKCVMIPG